MKLNLELTRELQRRLERYLAATNAQAPGLQTMASMNGIIGSTGDALSLASAGRDFLKAFCEADQENTIALLRQVEGGDQGALRSLNAIRTVTVNNFLWPDSDFATQFFNVVVLNPDEKMVVKYETNEEVRVTYVSGNMGSARHITITPDRSEVELPLKRLSTDKVDYQPRDIYMGDVSGNLWRTINLANDLAAKIDTACKTVMAAAIGSFTTTGQKSLRTYVAHSGIDATNLPTTNALQLATISGSTKFTEEVFKLVRQFCDSWGSDGPKPTGVIKVPSSETTQLAERLDVSSAVSNPVADSIFNNYLSCQYMGKTWTLVPSNRLPKGYCWPVLDRPFGTILTKPSMDLSIDTLAMEWMKCWSENQAWRWVEKVFHAYYVEPNRKNLVRVQYHS